MPTDEEKQQYISDLLAERGSVLQYHQTLADSDLDLLKALKLLVDTILLEERHLDRKTKELLVITTLTALKGQVKGLKSHLVAARDEAGLSAEEVVEAMEVALLFAGVDAFRHGYNLYCEVYNPRVIEPKSEG